MVTELLASALILYIELITHFSFNYRTVLIEGGLFGIKTGLCLRLLCLLYWTNARCGQTKELKRAHSVWFHLLPAAQQTPDRKSLRSNGKGKREQHTPLSPARQWKTQAPTMPPRHDFLKASWTHLLSEWTAFDSAVDILKRGSSAKAQFWPMLYKM